VGADNIVARGVRLAFEAAGRPFKGVAIRCVNRIPSARGLGSSAAAWVGGLVAGDALAAGALARDELLALAARAEGHPDNVCAALLGGLTVSAAAADGRITAIALPVPDGLAWVVLVPTISASTAETRAVLPASVSHADAVFNVQRVALLLADCRRGETTCSTPPSTTGCTSPIVARSFRGWRPSPARRVAPARSAAC